MTLADYEVIKRSKFLGDAYLAKIDQPKEIAVISESTGVMGPWVKYDNQILGAYLAHEIPGTTELLAKGIEPRFYPSRGIFVVVR